MRNLAFYQEEYKKDFVAQIIQMMTSINLEY